MVYTDTVTDVLFACCRPYRYGFPYEVSLTLNDDDRVVDEISKLYALGRTGAHGIAVMQDGFTVYIAGGRGGFFRWISFGVGTYIALCIKKTKFGD